jgi:lipopolysaccharide/colanic/teichoic acid biosynthesis glycosyltransferase
MKTLIDYSSGQGTRGFPVHLFRDRPRSWNIQDAVRRSIDVALSSALLVALLPVMLVVAAAVKLDSRGPVLFQHVRTGRNRRRADWRAGADRRKQELFGKPFTLYKFRTMYADARERFPELYRYSYSDKELRTIPIKVLVGSKRGVEGSEDDAAVSLSRYTDPRVTRVGKWLRKTSLDELPNLINVLKGDMHLVGPRPDIDSNIRYYREDELKILEVKPGVTGLAQIRGRGHLTFEQTNRFDLEYVRTRSLTLDLSILLKTIPVLWKREGAR